MKTRPIRTVEDIRRTITEIFSGKNVKVYLFGSRARGDHTLRSDLDLGFLSDEDIRYELSVLRETLRSLMFLSGWMWWTSPGWTLTSGTM